LGLNPLVQRVFKGLFDRNKTSFFVRLLCPSLFTAQSSRARGWLWFRFRTALQKCPPALCDRNFVPDPCNQVVKVEHPAVTQSAGPAGPVRPSHAVVPLGRRSAGDQQGNGLGSGARGRCRPGSAWRAHQRYFETSHEVPRVRAAVRRQPYTPAPPATAPIGARF
jgi:hypothetical protein